MVQQIALSMEIIGETLSLSLSLSQSSCLKPLYESSSGQLLLLALSFKFKAKPKNSKKSESWGILTFKKWSRSILENMLQKKWYLKSATLDLSFISPYQLKFIYRKRQ